MIHNAITSPKMDEIIPLVSHLIANLPCNYVKHKVLLTNMARVCFRLFYRDDVPVEDAIGIDIHSNSEVVTLDIVTLFFIKK